MALRSRMRKRGGIKILSGGLQQNRQESGAGSDRYGADFRIGYDSRRKRYVHVYGGGQFTDREGDPKKVVVAIRQSNPVVREYNKRFGRRAPQESVSQSSSGTSSGPLRSALADSARRAQAYSKEASLLRRRRRRSSGGYSVPGGGAK
jgi:hypothetical protein